MSKVVDYFLKYVAFDTQSAEDAGTVPSTEKQFALAKLLSEQLKNIGVKDVSMSEYGYVYGTIPANGDYNCQTVGFLAHMDTSPDCPVSYTHLFGKTSCGAVPGQPLSCPEPTGKTAFCSGDG